MDTLHHLSSKIEHLHHGESWTVSAKDLGISRADFCAILAFLLKEAKAGHFSVQLSPQVLHNELFCSETTIIKH